MQDINLSFSLAIQSELYSFLSEITSPCMNWRTQIPKHILRKRGLFDFYRDQRSEKPTFKTYDAHARRQHNTATPSGFHLLLFPTLLHRHNHNTELFVASRSYISLSPSSFIALPPTTSDHPLFGSTMNNPMSTLPAQGGLVVVIQTVPRVKGVMNHSYRDFSRVPPPPPGNNNNNSTLPTRIDEMTFAQKVHHMMSHAEYCEYIAWMPHGRAFKVVKPQLFEKFACPVYFGHSRYSSFLRSLNNYGFKHLSKGVDRNCK